MVLHFKFDVQVSSRLWIKLLTKIPFVFEAVEPLLRVSEFIPKVIHFALRNSCTQEEAVVIIISPHENSGTMPPGVWFGCHSIFTALPSLLINFRLVLHRFGMPDILSGKELLPGFPLTLMTSCRNNSLEKILSLLEKSSCIVESNYLEKILK